MLRGRCFSFISLRATAVGRATALLRSLVYRHGKSNQGRQHNHENVLELCITGGRADEFRRDRRLGTNDHGERTVRFPSYQQGTAGGRVLGETTPVGYPRTGIE